ncbi:MAG TPA: tail fiber domain-containing protein, partial [Candidatus Binataceae bacterium]|nr:tail fiber domain-containing protein [Candidatus Binataceae bacterium]
NTGGFNNTADGVAVLHGNTTGTGNTATGYQTMYHNTGGSSNTAIGINALLSNRAGANNIAVGAGAGQNVTGSNNIDIGNAGAAADSKTIRIGTQGSQAAVFIAGINTSGVMGTDVVINSTGQLGTVPSSARFKRDISAMGEASSGLMKLRPVTFFYKNDPAGIRQYGLVAEEVERVYPELITYDSEGKVETVRYSMLTSMLLNELQKQTRQLRNQKTESERQAERILELSAQMVAVRTSTGRALAAIQERLAAMEQAMRTANGAKLAAAEPFRK